jgi:hypothetical protein
MMSDKATLLRECETEFEALVRALRGLSEAQMRQVWCGTWSAREIVAHIAGWHREMTPALERMARGERPFAEGVSYDDVDAWNARFAEPAKSAATADLLASMEASHRAFMAAAAGVPAERFVPDKTAWKLVDLNGRHHYQTHAQDIAGWRKSQDI